MTEISYKGADEIKYKLADFTDFKYIKIIYKDKYDEVHEYKTETNYLSDNYLSLFVKPVIKKENTETGNSKEENTQETNLNNANSYLKKLQEIKELKEKAQASGDYSEYYKKLSQLQAQQEEPIRHIKHELPEIKKEENAAEEENNANNEADNIYKAFEAECPQQIMLKFVIDDLLYIAEATLEDVEIKRPRVYFRIKAPEILKFEQHRKYYRISLRRLCLLVATNNEGCSSAFLARSINLSAGGVLINRLETLAEDDKYITINPEEYSRFNLVIVLEMDKVLKLSARYVRQEEGKKSWRYGFEFTEISKEKTDFINKYVIGKQIDELRSEFDIKNKGHNMNTVRKKNF